MCYPPSSHSFHSALSPFPSPRLNLSAAPGQAGLRSVVASRARLTPLPDLGRGHAWQSSVVGEYTSPDLSHASRQHTLATWSSAVADSAPPEGRGEGRGGEGRGGRAGEEEGE
eukprot:601042-Rhodomonas_salina.1